MSLSKQGMATEPTKAELTEALKQYLHKADREEICAQQNVSSTTYYRAMAELDMANPLTQAIVLRAKTNKERAAASDQDLKSLV